MTLLIDKMRQHDTEFIMDSWLKSYRKAPGAARLPNGLYYSRQRQIIDHMLWFGTVKIARPDDWPEGITGWLCGEQTQNEFMVHYAFVKRFWRRKGVFRSMLEAFAPHGRLVFTHLRPPYTDYLRDMGMSHLPYYLVTGDKHVGKS